MNTSPIEFLIYIYKSATVSTHLLPSSTSKLVNFSALINLAFVNSANASKSYFFFTVSSDSFFNLATFDLTSLRSSIFSLS